MPVPDLDGTTGLKFYDTQYSLLLQTLGLEDLPRSGAFAGRGGTLGRLGKQQLQEASRWARQAAH